MISKKILPILVALVCVPISTNLAGTELVDDCQPCQYKIDSKNLNYAFYFKFIKQSDEERFINSIAVEYEGKLIQSLPIKEALPLHSGQAIEFGLEDINCDGYGDLMLVTNQAMVNAYANYWLFEPGTSKFSLLGNYPVFTIQDDECVLSTYERGGHGGLIYSSKNYAIKNNELQLIYIEKQDWVSSENAYLKIVKKLKRDKLQTVYSKYFSAEELMKNSQ